MGVMIVAGVIAILCQLAMGAVILVKVLKQKGLFDIVMMGGLGLLALGTLIMLFGGVGGIIGAVFTLIGWPATAVGFVVPRFAAVRQMLAAAPPAAQASAEGEGAKPE